LAVDPGDLFEVRMGFRHTTRRPIAEAIPAVFQVSMSAAGALAGRIARSSPRRVASAVAARVPLTSSQDFVSFL
jgi:hypothetical protein